MAVTRNSGKSSSSSTAVASAHSTDTKVERDEDFLGLSLAFMDSLDDNAPLQNRDAKVLRNAIAQVWEDSKARSELLSQKINEGNSALADKFNESFSIVGQRLDTLPTISMLERHQQDDLEIPKVNSFSGSSDTDTQFSIWLRRLEDVMRMRKVPLSPEQQANFLIGHLDGVAREKVEELDSSARKDYKTVVSHLKAFFESPQQRYVARQKLSTCRQEPGEPSGTFANRILHLVRAATSGQDPATQKERVLEEFVARLRGDIRYFVKLDNPATYEQAVAKAQMVKQLLSEASAERLMRPTSSVQAPVQVLTTSRSSSPRSPRMASRSPSRRVRFHSPPPVAPSQDFPRYRTSRPPIQLSGTVTCHTCGGRGHFSRECPTPVRQWSTTERFRQAGANPIGSGPGRASGGIRGSRAQLLSCDPVDNARSTSNRDCNSKDRTVACLTSALEESQAQLEQSKARISALLRRNDELSSSAFASPPAARSASPTSLPDVRLLFLCVVMSLCVGSQCSATQAWLCPNDEPTNLYFVPLAYNCSRLLPNTSMPVEQVHLRLYRPNTRVYSSVASLCKIVRHSVVYSVNFFGAHYETHSEIHLPVSVEECKPMALHRRCSHGNMTDSQGVWRTRNHLTYVFPSAPFGCCSDRSAAVINCYLTSTTVRIRHSDGILHSSVGDVSSCLYRDGSCILADGSAIIWTPEQEERCAYVFVGRLSGHSLGNVWLSNNKEFALSWTETSPSVSDCLKQLIVTDQGYAIQVSARQPRSTHEDVGLATSNQLSAQLLAVEGAAHSSSVSLIRHAFREVCERTNSLSLALQVALRVEPTFVMRALLQRPDISASYLGNGYVQVRRCIELPSTSVRLLPFNGTCYDAPRAELRLPSGSIWHAFLTPATGIVRRHAMVTDCSESGTFMFPSADGVQQFSPHDGSWSTVPTRDVRQVSSFPRLHAFNIPPRLTIFHNLVLTNFSEAADDHGLRELWTALDHKLPRELPGS